MSTALVLAGHGSHISPETAGIVWKHVDTLRAMGAADEVTAAFWKEMPSFHTVFNTLSADDITVVPLFTAQGYFTQTVIPAEMRLTGTVTERGGKHIRYTRTLSEHPYLGQVVRQRVEDAIRAMNASAENTAVAIIGHSTRRNPESRKATEAQAEAIRATGLAAEVQAVYLDDSPEIADIYTLTSAPILIAVPYFLALGSHTTIDVPAELALPPGQTTAQIQGHTVYYTPPIGIGDELVNVIIELANEGNVVGARHAVPLPGHNDPDGSPTETLSPQSPWHHFPTAGRERFIKTVHARGEIRFGELRVTPSVVHVWGDPVAEQVLETPAALRASVREQPFRPLATSTDLPRGWRVNIHSPEMLHAVVETVYPGALADWTANQTGSFTFNTLEQTASRQTGMYRPLDRLPIEQREAIVQSVCRNCVRHPTWFRGETPDEAIPCPEPCNVWLSRALEVEA